MTRLEDDQEVQYAMNRSPEQIRISKRFPFQGSDSSNLFEGQQIKREKFVLSATEIRDLMLFLSVIRSPSLPLARVSWLFGFGRRFLLCGRGLRVLGCITHVVWF